MAKARAKKKVTRWSDGSVPDEELAPNERIAHEIVSAKGDLAPSVQKIMDAELDDDARQAALEAFRSSLDEVGDPNRDPQVAIENALARG
ncbi:MAG: hypothetical protein WD225_03060 [Ilumatobacteraceae bacterium]